MITVKFCLYNRLVQQGMQPVYRVLPDKPEWERVLDRLIINVKIKTYFVKFFMLI